MIKRAEIIPEDGTHLIGKVYVVENDNGNLVLDFDIEDSEFVIEALANLFLNIIDQTESIEDINDLAEDCVKVFESLQI